MQSKLQTILHHIYTKVVFLDETPILCFCRRHKKMPRNRKQRIFIISQAQLREDFLLKKSEVRHNLSNKILTEKLIGVKK